MTTETAPTIIDGSELDALRSATPGCEHRNHLNNAGAALMTIPVTLAQTKHLELEMKIGGYEARDDKAGEIEATYNSVARLLGARSHQIAVMENATVAWNQAFHCLRLGPGDQVITSEADYAANFITYLQAARFHDVEIVIAPNDETGQLDVDALPALIDEQTKLISISHTPTNGGLVNPAAEIGAVARAHGVPYLLDACQTVGQIDIDVDEVGCDFLSATARKYLRGPRGIGFLYVSDAALEWAEPAILDHHGAPWTSLEAYTMRDDARRFENWEFNYAAVLGMGRAADQALALGMDRIEATVGARAHHLRERLTAEGFPVFDLGTRRCGLVTTAVKGVPADRVKAELDRRSINTSISDPDSTLVDASRRKLGHMVRISPHYYNTTDELDAAVAALVEIRSAGLGD